MRHNDLANDMVLCLMAMASTFVDARHRRRPHLQHRGQFPRRGFSVSVKSAAKHCRRGGTRGSSNRATVTVADQYGDPLPGSRVWLTTNLLDDEGDASLPDRWRQVLRCGSRRLLHVRLRARGRLGGATETLTAYLGPRRRHMFGGRGRRIPTPIRAGACSSTTTSLRMLKATSRALT